jgi:hypothetical protein
MINPKNRRYYSIYITRDLLGDISVCVWNGSLDNDRGGMRTYAFTDQPTALAFIAKKVRAKEKDKGDNGRYWLVYE